MSRRSLRASVRAIVVPAVLAAFAAASAATTNYPVTNPDSCNLQAPYAVVHEVAFGGPGFYEGFHIAVCDAIPAFEFSGVPDDKIAAVSVLNGAVVLVTEHAENHGLFPGRLVVSAKDVPDLAPYGLNGRVSSLWFFRPGMTVGDTGTFAVNYDRAGRKFNGAELMKALQAAGSIQAAPAR
jgi:hypothetical protein